MLKSWIGPIALLVPAAAAAWDGRRIMAAYPNQLAAQEAGGYILGLGLLLGGLALAHGFTEASRGAGPSPETETGREIRGAAIALALLAGYAWLVGIVGYMVSTAVFFVLAFRILGSYRWVPILVSSCAMALGGAYLWSAIGMPMPRGMFLPWP